MSGEPMRWCALGQHRVYAIDFRDERRAVCTDCHAKRERESRGEHTRQRELRRKWRYLILAAQARAKKKGLVFDLFDHAEEIKERVAAGKCELTGIPFNTGGKGRQWHNPSIDKIDPKGGYLYNNIRIILFGLNVAISDWGEESLRSMTEYLHRD